MGSIEFIGDVRGQICKRNIPIWQHGLTVKTQGPRLSEGNKLLVAQLTPQLRLGSCANIELSFRRLRKCQAKSKINSFVLMIVESTTTNILPCKGIHLIFNSQWDKSRNRNSLDIIQLRIQMLIKDTSCVARQQWTSRIQLQQATPRQDFQYCTVRLYDRRCMLQVGPVMQRCTRTRTEA